ncbi:SAM-dependent methyltransferase [Streptomyces olivoreticuli]
MLGQNQPHSARMYDFYLGGKTNYPIDRAAAAQVIAVYPGIMICARNNRAFMQRATRLLANRGVRQWLDIGTGIPTSPNLHEIAQSIAPEARVVYVDNDPIVLAYSRALLTSTAEGRTAYVEANILEPESILRALGLVRTLDLTQPVALSLNAVMHFVPDDQDPYGIVRRLMDALPRGSALALSHCTPDFDPATWRKVTEVYIANGTHVQFRSRVDVERFFEGLELVEPGVEVPHRWHPAEAGGTRMSVTGPTDADISLYAGVAFKR